MSSVLRLYPTDAPLEGAVSAPLGSSSVPVTLSTYSILPAESLLGKYGWDFNSAARGRNKRATCVCVTRTWFSKAVPKQSTSLACRRPWD